MKPLRKLLIANRGEIAVRIMKTAQARGIATVAVYSEADADALHVRMADEAVCIGAPEASQSYLRIEAIIAAAQATGADSIHPGYGFLSERAAFADACAEAGIVFVGPPSNAIAAMGDKAESKRRMIAAGVPTIPGYQGEDQDDETLRRAAIDIGFPVMLKASAGGGGRGQRIVHDEKDLAEAIESARRESRSAFGDDRLIVEKAVIGARHIEIQVLADAHGSIVHLGERDCSLQRRRQKVIEEAPSPVMTPALRAAMGAAAVDAARSVGYVNAGTVEFLFDPVSEAFYFLEMNTRLQVEHPVTECVTGLDLVSLQIDVASGLPLPFAQDDIELNGWAIEARLYAEDPEQDFLPHAGVIAAWTPPHAVRVDAGVAAGDRITTHYDPMIAKVVAHGRTRDEARMKLSAALRNMSLLGVGSNRDFLVALLEDEAFARGDAATDYIENHLTRLAARKAPGGRAELAILAAALLDPSAEGPLAGWNSRRMAGFPLRVIRNGRDIVTADIALDGRRITASSSTGSATIDLLAAERPGMVRYSYDGRHFTAAVTRDGATVEIDANGAWARYVDLAFAPAGGAAVGDGILKAPMAGLVSSVRAVPGAAVRKGDTLVTVEAMKMEHQLKAPCDGVISEVLVKPGDQVAIRARLVAVLAG